MERKFLKKMGKSEMVSRAKRQEENSFWQGVFFLGRKKKKVKGFFPFNSFNDDCSIRFNTSIIFPTIASEIKQAIC